MKNLTQPVVITVEFTAAEAARIRAYVHNNGAYADEQGGPEMKALNELFEAAGIKANYSG